MALIQAWLSKAWGWLALTAAALLGLLAIRQSGKAAGREDIRREMDEQAARAREKAREVDQELDALDADAIRRRAEQWMRKPQD